MRASSPHRRNFNDPGHAHELTFSCYHRFPFLKADRTCLWLAEAIDAARQKFAFDLWDYVFMPDHMHLIIHPRQVEYDIAAIRAAIKRPVGLKAIAFLESEAPHWLKKITRRRGSRIERLFWQSGGGYDRNITEPATLMAMIDYLHLNPVRRGLAERAVDWKWSSAAWFILNSVVPFVPDRIPPEWMMGT